MAQLKMLAPVEKFLIGLVLVCAPLIVDLAWPRPVLDRFPILWVKPVEGTITIGATPLRIPVPEGSILGSDSFRYKDISCRLTFDSAEPPTNAKVLRSDKGTATLWNDGTWEHPDAPSPRIWTEWILLKRRNQPIVLLTITRNPRGSQEEYQAILACLGS